MNLTRTEQIWLKDEDILSELCHLSKNLWNEANYQVRQEFFASGRWTRYNTLAGNLKASENFKSLNAQTAQQILKILDRSWKSFFKVIKEYAKHPEKFLGRPKLPGYKEKDGEFVLVFTNQQVKIESGYVTFPKNLQIEPIKTRLENDTKVCEVRIIPKGIGYVCEIVYETQSEEGEINKRWYSRRINENRIVGIDFGLRNIVTMSNNIGEKPIVIKGGAIKSMNQYYNKIKAELQSIYDKQGIKSGSKMDILTTKRNLKIKDAMHKISRYIIDWCVDHNIGTIVIGHNDNWKQEVELGKRNNQNFVSIPYYILTHDIQYKGEEIGVEVKLQEESHTSKCSFLDSEPIEHRDNYVGKRIKRGIFRSAKGIFINADVNGSLNIIRKAFSNAFPQGNADGIEGVGGSNHCGLHPERANIKKILSFEGVC